VLNFTQGPGVLHCVRCMRSSHCVKCLCNAGIALKVIALNFTKHMHLVCVAFYVCVTFGWKPLLTVLLLEKTARATCFKYRKVKRDTSNHGVGRFGPMARQFRPWGWTVRYLCPKCLLNTSALVPKCPDTSHPSE